MPGSQVLVLGATGPSGICVLRELLDRDVATLAYVRNPAKIPADLSGNPRLQVMRGGLDDEAALDVAVGQCRAIISCLGPSGIALPVTTTPFAAYYATMARLMRKHGVRRILVLSTISATHERDRPTVLGALVVWVVRLFANRAYRTMRSIAAVFRDDADADADQLDWTVFRVPLLLGGADEPAWRRDRLQDLFAGYVGHDGWSISVRRGMLARWLVDAVESDPGEWIRGTPAVASRKPAKYRSA